MEEHHHDHGNLNRLAFHATLHCLTGCASGEVLGFLLGAWFGLGVALTIILSIFLAFVFSYILTMRPLLASGMEFRPAFKIAIAADTLSVTTMEITDNAIMLIIPGATMAMPSDFMFWSSLAIALGIAFVVTLPVNRWMIRKGKGHSLIMHDH
jgi:hypothetical protein